MPAHHRFAAGVNNPPSALMRVTATDNQVFIFLQAANKPFFQLTAHHGFEEMFLMESITRIESLACKIFASKRRA